MVQIIYNHTTKYCKPRPYRDRVIEYHKHLGITKFSKDMQFWTLGGKGHDEFIELSKYLEFGPGSYHTVDRGRMKPKVSDAMVLYQQMEFSTATHKNKGWRNIAAISYDSTSELVCNNGDFARHDGKFNNLIGLVRSALNNSKHDFIVVHSNWMLAHPRRCKNLADENFKDAVARDYKRWVEEFLNEFDCDGYKVDFPETCNVEQMALTKMIDMHFHINKV